LGIQDCAGENKNRKGMGRGDRNNIAKGGRGGTGRRGREPFKAKYEAFNLNVIDVGALIFAPWSAIGETKLS